MKVNPNDSTWILKTRARPHTARATYLLVVWRGGESMELNVATATPSNYINGEIEIDVSGLELFVSSGQGAKLNCKIYPVLDFISVDSAVAAEDYPIDYERVGELVDTFLANDYIGREIYRGNIFTVEESEPPYKLA